MRNPRVPAAPASNNAHGRESFPLRLCDLEKVQVSLHNALSDTGREERFYEDGAKEARHRRMRLVENLRVIDALIDSMKTVGSMYVEAGSALPPAEAEVQLGATPSKGPDDSGCDPFEDAATAVYQDPAGDQEGGKKP